MWLQQAGAQEGPHACSRSELGKEVIKRTKILLHPYLFLRRARLLPCFRFRIFTYVNETNLMSLKFFLRIHSSCVEIVPSWSRLNVVT